MLFRSHPEGDVWNHTLECLDRFAVARDTEGWPEDESLLVGLAVLCHDFGKPACTRYDPEKKRIRSLGHDEAGVEPTLAFLRRLTNEERLLRDVPPLVRGRDPIALGMKPGPEFKRILSAAYDAQLEGEFSTTEDGIRFLASLSPLLQPLKLT